ncbi:hypothetical protein B0T25DRAFT_569092 [Lasiosphaeria hispida]|uniref:NAD(P)-binding protein n=1 Tax=Lasiosphaeria hispida TaxID=260671 RepID=A0AAJ0HJT9_9PEZI|nr:hypothetical protein B0T25DRAFT_569092 [Lasiosphaeria hispida]
MATDSTVVFITGAGRGIGKTLVQTYLLRPNHTIIGSVRDKTSPNAQELQGLPTAAGTRLLLHVDVVIANAGGSGSRGDVVPLELVDAKAVTDCFTVNTLGPLLLFQAVRPLLQRSGKSPAWVAITSAVGSVGNMEAFGAHAAHSGNKWLVAFVVHPGLVQTESGNKAAGQWDWRKHRILSSRVLMQFIHLIDSGSREKSSGKFYNAVDGTEIPW